MIVALLVLTGMLSYIALTGDGSMPFIPDDPAVQAQVDALQALTPLDILPGLAERMMTITLLMEFSRLFFRKNLYHLIPP